MWTSARCFLILNGTKFLLCRSGHQSLDLIHSSFSDSWAVHPQTVTSGQSNLRTRMWANAQRDGCPAEHRWRPLFNAAVWLTLTTRCCAVMLPRCETRWNLQGCLKLPDQSQPQVGRSSPYCGDMWRTYCCLISFFRRSIRALVAKI